MRPHGAVTQRRSEKHLVAAASLIQVVAPRFRRLDTARARLKMAFSSSGLTSIGSLQPLLQATGPL